MKARTLMIQGTGSHVGKSVLTAAFCRMLRRRGLRVAPFKAQNMANNSYVTAEGGEIGRAQAVQAEAAGVEATVDMNPILLKPSSDRTVQTVLLGKPVQNHQGILAPRYRERFLPTVRESLKRLMRDYDVVVIEGAGSPAEVNLRSRDLVNMTVARLAEAPVILVGNIDWGGIFAQLAGTYSILKPWERRHVRAFLINKFRGDETLLTPGLRWLKKETGVPTLGVLPFIPDLNLPEEDSMTAGLGMDSHSGNGRGRNKGVLAHIIQWPRISNFTDFDLLRRMPGVNVRFIRASQRNVLPDVLILPGTKSTMADLAWLRRSGLDAYVFRCAKAGVPVVGICGGYQMMGHLLRDPYEVESSHKKMEGLGLLPVETVFRANKTLTRVQARISGSHGDLEAYEIHMGKTTSRHRLRPWFQIREENGQRVRRPEGIRQDRGGMRLYGTYLHGIFQNPEFLEAFMNEVRQAGGLPEAGQKLSKPVDVFDRLADITEEHLDGKLLDRILKLK